MKKEERKKLFLPRTTSNRRFATTRTCASMSDYRFVLVRAGSWLIIFMLCVTSNISALDFGVVLHQNAAAYNTADSETAFEYNAVFAPRLSFLTGENGTVFISAAMNFGYKDDFYYAPDLLRTEYSVQGRYLGFRMGRKNYQDPTAFIVNGLFDGLQLTHTSRAGRFGLGAWYTGFQYKKSANITMTAEELVAYNTPLDYADFADTYFAPSRLLASVDWEHLSLFGFLRLTSALTGQFDFSNAETKLHTQYFTLKAGVRFNSVLFELGGTLGTAQTVSEQETAFNLSLAGEVGIHWTLSTSFNSRLSFTTRYASGRTGELEAFVPVSTVYQGNIFQTKLTSLTVPALNYTARISRAFGTDITASYFIRNDLETPNTYPIGGEGNNGYLLGGELFARLIWSPFSDLQINLGGGTFIPALGNNWKSEKPLWRADISIILAY